jgi:TonB family protein
VSTRLAWGKRLLVLATATVFAASLATAQQTVVEEGKRKVKSRTAPVYPDLARRMNVSGKVRVELTIAPDGHVKSSRPLGGHPVLVQSCLEATKDWKFDAAPEESIQIIEFNFKEQ